jgi:hypothetical protein
MTAHDVQPQETTPANSTQFQAVEGGAETQSGAKLMVAAYAVLWVIVMAYLVMVWRKQAAMSARMDELDRILDKAAAKMKKK